MGTMPSERARNENGFPGFKEDHFDISDTPHSGRPSEFDEDRVSTLIYNDPRQCTRQLAKCDELWPLYYRAAFAFNGQG